MKEKQEFEKVIKKLELMLDVKMKETGKNISACREIVLQEAKNSGLIKDYKWTQHFNQKIGYVYFGSKVGFDSMYKIFI